jgi:uncharacterized membrane protein YebE (DUF533 family)
MFDAKQLLDAFMGAGQARGGGAQGGGIADMLGAVLGQATQGLQGAARDVNAKTGVGNSLENMLGSLTGGQGSADLLAKAKDFAGQNQLATGAGLGSLAALVLGTSAGRGFAADTAKLGGLAMIGGLAYQAWQNYQAGKPPLALGKPEVAEAPAASPFGTTGDEARDNATAMLILRSMIAAASADGVVDAKERAHIVGSLQQIGLAPEAAQFLDREFARPATPQDLVAGVTQPEVGAQVYAAARLTIDPDHPAEKAFLDSLAFRLGLNKDLVQHIDAAAKGVKSTA